VLDEAGFLRAACKRGELMGEASAVPGAMLSLTAKRADVGDTLARLKQELGEALLQDLVIANHNSGNQVVLSGPRSAIEAVEDALDQAGYGPRRLDVGTAFHSPLVSASCAPFERFVSGLQLHPPRLPVYSGTRAEPYPQDPAAVRELLSEQIAKPIEFVALIEAMYARGVRCFVELGPSAVLSGLVGRILGQRPHRAIPVDRRGRHGIGCLHRALAKLAAAGVPMQLSALWARRRVPGDPRDQSKPKLSLAIDGTSYGKP